MPARFAAWRPVQELAVNRLLDTKRRFPAHALPTGSGKTLTAITYAVLTGKRTIYLTSTKGLADQIIREFGEVGVVDVRGMSNYPCDALIEGVWPDQLQYWRMTQGSKQPTVEDGPCHAGSPCARKDAGCGYYDAVKRARAAKIVVTNYSFWMASNLWSEGLGDFDLMVCDEAHEVPDEIAGFLKVEFKKWDLDLLGYGDHWPKPGATLADWGAWARSLWTVADRKAALFFSVASKKREYRRMTDIRRRLEVIRGMEDDWIPEPIDGGWSFEPKWPKSHAESTLFLGTPMVIFMSATVRPKTLDLCGIPATDSEFFEYPSSFPAGRRPVIHIPTVRVNFRTTPSEMKWWAARIDQIINGRMDRKGIIHTVSYERAKYIYLNSEHHEIMLLPSGRDTRTVVEAFKARYPPAILVSPAVSTGWDFPYEACEYQIIGKLAFPDTRSAVMSARTEEDKDYAAYLAMIQLVQASGRGMRAADDICETIIVDDNVGWFMSKYRGFAPDWFLKAMSRRDMIPTPPPKIGGK